MAVVVSRNEETTHLVPDAAVVSDWRVLVTEDLDGVVAWAEGWRVKFSMDECKVVHVGRSSVDFEYEMEGE